MEKIFENSEIKHTILPNIEYIQFKRLLKYPEIKHAYVLKSHDKDFRMGKEYEKIEEVKKNLEEISNLIGINYKNIIRPDFQHTNNVECVETLGEEQPELKNSRFKNTDGLVSNQDGIAIMSTNADCNLILMYDPTKKVFANTHARLERNIFWNCEKYCKENEKSVWLFT